jgi:hypothetical protein
MILGPLYAKLIRLFLGFSPLSHLYRDTTLLSLSDFDMLTVMGGPISANDEARLARSRDRAG